MCDIDIEIDNRRSSMSMLTPISALYDDIDWLSENMFIMSQKNVTTNACSGCRVNGILTHPGLNPKVH